ncbi:MAG: SDR family NAD(P)-dependent oxidoreductase [Clostridiales bacterium]|nr:SDR family NAD(P)-dependent oxidoreductase [Clostridiales bacterium]
MFCENYFLNKTAISTGAGSGMGFCFAQAFANLGGNVVLCDVNEQALNEKVAQINQNGKGKAIGVVCDVRDYKQICSACEKTIEAFGSIDVLVNFAGGTARRVLAVGWQDDFPDVPIEVFDWGLTLT